MEQFMKKATLIIWVIIFGFIALVIFQNQTFFLAKNAFRIDLGVFESYLSPQLPNAVLILMFFFSGIIIAYLFNFSARFKAKRTIKKLNNRITSRSKEMSELKREINALKGVETPEEDQADTVKLDRDASPKNSENSTAEHPADADKTIKYDMAENSDDADKTIKYGAANETADPAGDSEETSDEKKEQLQS
jgi:uncharacterized integral membrane protein